MDLSGSIPSASSPVAGILGSGSQVGAGSLLAPGGITTPVAPSTPSTPSADTTVTTDPTNTTTTTDTGTTTDPNAVAYYNDLITQLGSELTAAQNEQPTGINNIDQAFNDSENQLNQGESTALTGYNTQNAENGTQRESNIGTINTNANQAYNSLMAMLGASGSGVSSAAEFGAPQAVSFNASGQRAGADTTYNTNANSIASAEGTTQQQYQNALQDLLTQKNNSTQSFLTGLLGNEASLDQQIAAAKVNSAEYGGETYAQAEEGANNQTTDVNNIENQLSSIFAQYATPTFNVTPVTASTPNLTQYSVDPTTISTQNQNPTTDSSFLPYLASLQQNPNSTITTTPTSTPATPSAATAGVASS